MTHWRWITVSPDLDLTLTLDSDDPEMIRRVEASAEANGISLERILGDPWVMPKDEPKPLPTDYWEGAQ